MALVRDLSQAQLAFQVEGGAPEEFLVVRYRGTEGLCRLYRFDIDLVSTAHQTAFDFDKIVGRAAVLSVQSDWGPRWFHGVVSRFELKEEINGQLSIRAELVPALWLLTHRYHCRIFQQEDVKEIISTVLIDGGIASDRFDLSDLQHSYAPREYCVQYRETDYNFICRLMEEEGIRWFFRQTLEGHVLVLADSTEYPPLESEPAIPFVDPSNLNPAGESVSRFRLSYGVRPDTVVLRDFNFEKPQLDLESSGDRGADTGLEFSDYPGKYVDQAGGTRFAKLRAEEFEASRVTGVGLTGSPRLSPGVQFDLADHPIEAFNGKYLITSLTHEGKESTTRSTTATNGRGSVLEPRVHQLLVKARQSNDADIQGLAEALMQIAVRLRAGDPTARQSFARWLYHAGQVCREGSGAATAAGRDPFDGLAVPDLLDEKGIPLVDLEAPTYTCSFECIPAGSAFRPPRVTPWPVMRGSQTARVVGPKGEEIHTDKYGRVKVQFNWDREGKLDESASCWIRVSQGSAGGQYGMMFLPRIGQEVIVDFLEGDPDQPIITGRVYNADHMPPYPLPDEKTKSCIKTNSSKGGGGTNEIRFEDLKGEEQILIHAEKDHDLRVKNDHKGFVGNDQHAIVKRDRFEQIERNVHRVIKGDRATTLESDDHRTVKGDTYEKVEGGTHMVVAGDQAEKIDGECNLEVGKNRNEKAGQKISVEAGQEIHTKAGMALAFEAGQNVHIKGGMNVVMEGGVGLTIKVGGNFVNISPAGVFISGTMVLINSGGAAGSGSGCSPTAPAPPSEPDPAKEPLEAVKAKSGKDVPPKGEPSPQAVALKQAAVAGVPFCEVCEEAESRARFPHATSRASSNAVNIVFEPDRSRRVQDCTAIGHVQVVQALVDGRSIGPGAYHPTFAFADDIALTNGSYVDGFSGQTSPDYQSVAAGSFGSRTGGASVDARLGDAPRTGGGTRGFYHPTNNPGGYKKVVYKFETFAWCKRGSDCPQFYEGVKWKYVKTWRDQRDGRDGVSTITDRNARPPSANFRAAYDRFLSVRGYTPCT